MTSNSTSSRSLERPIRVLLADDHELVRDGIRARLQKVPELEIVGEATNGREARADDPRPEARCAFDGRLHACHERS
ncbi:MAG: hypothetical protein AAFY05_24540 [Pseudomonadota bacterium]